MRPTATVKLYAVRLAARASNAEFYGAQCGSSPVFSSGPAL